MSKLIQINEHFSAVQGSKTELKDELNCECFKGTLYVNSDKATGFAETSKSKVVVLVDGGTAVQKDAGALVQSVAAKGVLKLLAQPDVQPKRQTKGASIAAGCDSQKSLNAIVAQSKAPRF